MREVGPNRCTTLPSDPQERKKYPIFSGCLAYFPDAIAAVAHLSWRGNQQHNPGEPLHWARGKSMDQEDTLVRHLMESGGEGSCVSGFDSDGELHSVKIAWRALAKAQLEIEALRDAQRDADRVAAFEAATPPTLAQLNRKFGIEARERDAPR